MTNTHRHSMAPSRQCAETSPATIAGFREAAAFPIHGDLAAMQEQGAMPQHVSPGARP